MKHFLAFSSAVLLVTIAIADKPTAKYLYDRDFMIMEGVEFPLIVFKYGHHKGYGGNYLGFYSVNNKTKDSFSEEMNIKEGFEKQTTNFTIEVHSNYPKDYEPGLDTFCKDNSSEALRGLIKSCNARTLLREMTFEEQEQMRKFREEQKKTPTRGKAIFGRNGKIKVNIPDNVGYFDMSSEIFKYGPTADTRSIYYVALDEKFNFSRPLNYLQMDLYKQSLPKSFVIEGLPYGSGIDCSKTEFRDVKPELCDGEIRLRSLTKHD